MANKRLPRERLKRRAQLVSAHRNDDADVRLLVLYTSDTEWIAIDCASLAFVRAGAPNGPEPSSDDDRAAQPTTPSLERFDIVSARTHRPSSPIDPARPEGVQFLTAPTRAARPTRRSLKRLLRELCVLERPGAVILGSRGPSIAYTELDASMPSVELLRLGRRPLQLDREGDEARLGFMFASIAHRLPIVAGELAELAGKARRSREEISRSLGRRVDYALVALGPIEDGHVRKVLVDLIPARRTRARSAG